MRAAATKPRELVRRVAYRQRRAWYRPKPGRAPVDDGQLTLEEIAAVHREMAAAIERLGCRDG